MILIKLNQYHSNYHQSQNLKYNFILYDPLSKSSQMTKNFQNLEGV